MGIGPRDRSLRPVPATCPLVCGDLKGRHTRGDWSQGPVAGTGPCDQVPSCEQANFRQKSGRRDWILVPEIGPKNSNWFEFVGPVAGTGPRNILLGPSCEQVRGTGPCDQLKTNQSLISILSSHNSARSCFKMATPESEQIEQTVGNS